MVEKKATWSLKQQRHDSEVAWIGVMAGFLLILLVVIVTLLFVIFTNGLSLFWPRSLYSINGVSMLYLGRPIASQQVMHLFYNPAASEELILWSDQSFQHLVKDFEAWTIESLESPTFFGHLDQKDLHDPDIDKIVVSISPYDSVTIHKKNILLVYQNNRLNIFEKLKIFFIKLKYFVTSPPREANLEGGILPALVGTVLITLIMTIFLIPIGIATAIYMREIASQSLIVSLVRVAVGNLAGVPSIVYGVFGLGFFAYTLGHRIDKLFFADRLPSPTFGSGCLLWASLTLALLTMPILIVSTEEALNQVETSLREAALGCGATRFQMIMRIVLPKASPGILTGIILSLSRAVGEVAPLILTGVVKYLPSLPIDQTFPFIHLNRNFSHLAYHIYDLGFHSRSIEIARAPVFASIALLIVLVFILNGAALLLRVVLRKTYQENKTF